jgi:hypothetical protein
MRRFWKRDEGLLELEKELRARRSEAPEKLVRAIAHRARGDHTWLRPQLRVSFAAVVALAAFAAFFSAGGFGVVKTGAHGPTRIFDRLTASSSPANTVSTSAASDQYRGQCGTQPPYGSRCVVSIKDASGNEPEVGCVNVSVPLTVTPDNAEPITVTYHTVDGTATAADGDYIAQPSGSTTIPAHTRNWQIVVQICRDHQKGDEYFFVVLDSVSAGATIGNPSAKVTIKDKFKN